MELVDDIKVLSCRWCLTRLKIPACLLRKVLESTCVSCQIAVVGWFMGCLGLFQLAFICLFPVFCLGCCAVFLGLLCAAVFSFRGIRFLYWVLAVSTAVGGVLQFLFVVCGFRSCCALLLFCARFVRFLRLLCLINLLIKKKKNMIENNQMINWLQQINLLRVN